VLSRFQNDAPQPRGIARKARALRDRSGADLEPFSVALGVISFDGIIRQLL